MCIDHALVCVGHAHVCAYHAHVCVDHAHVCADQKLAMDVTQEITTLGFETRSLTRSWGSVH